MGHDTYARHHKPRFSCSSFITHPYKLLFSFLTLMSSPRSRFRASMNSAMSNLGLSNSPPRRRATPRRLNFGNRRTNAAKTIQRYARGFLTRKSQAKIIRVLNPNGTTSIINLTHPVRRIAARTGARNLNMRRLLQSFAY